MFNQGTEGCYRFTRSTGGPAGPPVLRQLYYCIEYPVSTVSAPPFGAL